MNGGEAGSLRFLGCHLSASGGWLAMARTALSIGTNSFQFFTRNPRGGAARAHDPADMAACNAFTREHGFVTIVAHAPYAMNLCSDKAHVRKFAREVMREDLLRLQDLDRVVYNFHPGSHAGQGPDRGITLIIEALNQVLTDELGTPVLLETMAGKGSENGRTFGELARIIDGVTLKDQLGVCLDTCHLNDAGYDLVNHLDGVLDDFDRQVGLDRLLAIHLNDSLNPLASGRDRHARTGEGTIGFKALAGLFCHPALGHLPCNLETPNDLAGYREEIRQLRRACGA